MLDREHDQYELPNLFLIEASGGQISKSKNDANDTRFQSPLN